MLGAHAPGLRREIPDRGSHVGVACVPLEELSEGDEGARLRLTEALRAVLQTRHSSQSGRYIRREVLPLVRVLARGTGCRHDVAGVLACTQASQSLDGSAKGVEVGGFA